MHFNTALQRWVMLLNHVNGSYNDKSDYFSVCFAVDLSDPMSAWSKPERLIKRTWPGMSMYPQVIGTLRGESDTEIGSTARFFIRGWSKWEAVFANVTVHDGSSEETRG